MLSLLGEHDSLAPYSWGSIISTLHSQGKYHSIVLLLPIPGEHNSYSSFLRGITFCFIYYFIFSTTVAPQFFAFCSTRSIRAEFVSFSYTFYINHHLHHSPVSLSFISLVFTLLGECLFSSLYFQQFQCLLNLKIALTHFTMSTLKMMMIIVIYPLTIYPLL